jgi:hypothetical protein
MIICQTTKASSPAGSRKAKGYCRQDASSNVLYTLILLAVTLHACRTPPGGPLIMPHQPCDQGFCGVVCEAVRRKPRREPPICQAAADSSLGIPGLLTSGAASTPGPARPANLGSIGTPHGFTVACMYGYRGMQTHACYDITGEVNAHVSTSATLHQSSR